MVKALEKVIWMATILLGGCVQAPIKPQKWDVKLVRPDGTIQQRLEITGGKPCTYSMLGGQTILYSKSNDEEILNVPVGWAVLIEEIR